MTTLEHFRIVRGRVPDFFPDNFLVFPEQIRFFPNKQYDPSPKHISAQSYAFPGPFPCNFRAIFRQLSGNVPGKIQTFSGTFLDFFRKFRDMFGRRIVRLLFSRSNGPCFPEMFPGNFPEIRRATKLANASGSVKRMRSNQF